MYNEQHGCEATRLFIVSFEATAAAYELACCSRSVLASYLRLQPDAELRLNGSINIDRSRNRVKQ